MATLPGYNGDLDQYLIQNSATEFYTVDHGWDTESEERTRPWLVWTPPEDTANEGELPEEVRWARTLKNWGRFEPWQPFKKRTGKPERFVSINHYGRHEDRKEERENTVEELWENFGGESNPVSPTKIEGLCAVRDEARKQLGERTVELEEKVMEPLRKIFLACAIETIRAITSFRPLPEVEDAKIEKLNKAAFELDHLYSHGIGDGISFDIIHEHENWYGRTFQHIPAPLAEGVKAALLVYVERAEEKTIDSSRDGILDRAQPVYFKWEAARRMIWSALYGWPLSEVDSKIDPRTPSERGKEYLSAVLEVEGKSFDGLSEWCTAVVNRSPKPNGETPNWQAFRDWLIRNGLYEPYGSFEAARGEAEEWAREVHGTEG